MHVLVVGANGQLGRALAQALESRGHSMSAWSLPDVDISAPETPARLAELEPDFVINAAAWTDVDGAEANPAAAYAANALGPRFLAEGCERIGKPMLQVSTNEVFAGTPGRIYFEYDEPAPGGTYARSKLAGERAVTMACRQALIVRVAWLFGPGSENFPTKIAAAADRLGALRVVGDEYGNPTYAPDAAAAMVCLVEMGRPGIYHLTNAGHTSRYGLAAVVLQASGRGHVPLTPIAADEWVRATRPPAHAVLANQTAAALGVTLRPWQAAVEEYAATLAAVAPVSEGRAGAPGLQNGSENA